MKKSELKQIIKECHIEIINENLFDKLKKKLDDFLYNKHHQKNPEKWDEYANNMKAILNTDLMKKYAKDRLKISKLYGAMKYAIVTKKNYVEAKKYADQIENIFDRLPNQKKYKDEETPGRKARFN